MARYTKQSVTSIAGINSELTKIQTAISDSLSRKGDTPNQMQALLDMNSNRIINLPMPDSDLEPVRRVDLEGVIGSAIEAALEALAVALNPEREGPVDLSTLPGGVMDFTEIEYTPGTGEIWVFANGSKLELNTDYTETSSTSITFTPTYLSNAADDTRIEVWTVAVTPTNGFDLFRDRSLEAYVTLEQFNPLAGSGGDDTAAFDAACTASFIQGRPIQLLAKTYRVGRSTSPRNVSAIQGFGKSSILLYNEQTNPKSTMFDFVLTDGGWFKDFVYDGNLSEDPVAWNNSNYDAGWLGGRGYRILGSENITIQNVHTRNTYNPGHGLYNCKRTRTIGCTATRSRGNFGDGFIVAEGEQHYYENCYAYDFTRIGFVGDKTTGSASSFTTRVNCIAIYGHDASVLYGGIESNTGFWDEFSVNVTNIRCLSYDTTHSGFRAPMINDPRYDTVLYAQDAFSYSCVDCVAGKTVEGYIAGTLGLTDGLYSFTNCIGYDCTIPFFIGGDAEATNPRKLVKVLIQNCKAFMAEGVVGRAVLPQGGDVTVDGLDVYYKTVPDWQAVAESESGTGTIGWFGDSNNRPRKLHVKNLRSLDAITKMPISSRVAQGFTTKNNEVILENCERVFMDAMSCFKFVSRNVQYDKLGTVQASQSVDIQGGAVSEIYTVFPTSPRVVLPVYSTTLMIVVDNVRFGLPDGVGQTLYIANITNSTDFTPKVRISRCRFRKDMTTGSPISLNADVPRFDTQNVMRFIIENNLFINTGGSTSQPIVRSLQREVIDNTVNVQVMGKSNYRSNNTAVLATTGVITTNFEALPFDAA